MKLGKTKARACRYELFGWPDKIDDSKKLHGVIVGGTAKINITPDEGYSSICAFRCVTPTKTNTTDYCENADFYV